MHAVLRIDADKVFTLKFVLSFFITHDNFDHQRKLHEELDDENEGY